MLIDKIIPIGKKIEDLLKDEKYLDNILKKGAETLFSRKFGGGGGVDIMDTRFTAPKFAAGKSMGFYTPSKARSSGTMGMQAKAVDPDTLRNDWFMRLRRYYTTKKYYS